MKTDLQLTTARRDLLSLDRITGKLVNKFGNDVVSRRDYLDAEDRRWEALDRLATVPAGSPEGMIAKASALKARSVIEDPDRQAAIAVSLADDVIRNFG